MPWPPSFSIDHERREVVLRAPPDGTSLSAHANAAFQAAVDDAINGNVFPTLNGRHIEHFRVMGARDFVQIERFASSLFGIATRGAHLTCYVRSRDIGEFKVWVARRSPKLNTYPGMLDSTVAGGVKADHSPLDCILAEATEEASLPTNLVSRQVRSVGVITVSNINARSGLHHSEILYVYDMEMDEGTIPQPHDGEVEEFVLMGCDELRTRMLAGEFKPNVCGVMIDFFVRHGVVTPENERDYVDICARLRRRLPVPTVGDSL